MAEDMPCSPGAITETVKHLFLGKETVKHLDEEDIHFFERRKIFIYASSGLYPTRMSSGDAGLSLWPYKVYKERPARSCHRPPSPVIA
jgi:hypothetical protein